MNTQSDIAGPFGYLNGEYGLLNEIKVSAMDRGFLYGDGCYEVLPVYKKKPFMLSAHLDRLYENLQKIELPFFEGKQALTAMLEKLISMSAYEYEYIYIQVTRGSYPNREHIFPATTAPTVFAYTLPFTPPEFYKASKGIVAITLEDFRWERCDIKAISLLGHVLSREKAKAENAEESILIKDGFVTEASVSNVFIVKNDIVTTPPLSNLILPGITRAIVIDILKSHNIEIIEGAISEAELRDADEIWTTSSTKEIVPIAFLDGKKLLGPYKLWEQIFKLYQAQR